MREALTIALELGDAHAIVACLETAARARRATRAPARASGAPPISCASESQRIRQPDELAHQERVEAQLRAALGEADFAAALAEGAALPLEDAVKQALE